MSIKEQIQDLLGKHRSITLDELAEKLPGVKKNTVKSYFHRLKKDTSVSDKTGQKTKSAAASKKPEKESKSVVTPKKSAKESKSVVTPEKSAKESKSVVTPEKSAKESKSVVTPKKSAKESKSVVTPEKSAKESKSVVTPKKSTKESKSVVTPKKSTKESKSTNAPKKPVKGLTRVTASKKPVKVLKTVVPVKSNRKRVSEYLTKNPDSSLDDLGKKFKDIKQGTLSSYFYTLKQKTTPKVDGVDPKSDKVTLKSRVSLYLDKNPDSKLSDLREQFPDQNNNYLSVIQGRWRKGQTGTDKPIAQDKPSNKGAAMKANSPITPEVKSQPAIKVKKNKPMDDKKSASFDSSQLIAALQKTITAQEKTIAAQEKAIALESKKNDPELTELAGMAIDDIKKVAATYLRGLKDLPSKFRS